MSLARSRERLLTLILAVASVLATALAVELALRLAGWTPARFASPASAFSPHWKVYLDCYPTNPRGYFDLDLRDPATRERYRALGVRRLDEVAHRAPHAVELRFNSLRFRDAELLPKPPGLTRVVVLGDSFTEGQGVKEQDTLVRVLERRLQAVGSLRYEVRNCGRRAADFPTLDKMFERILPFEPDLVVYAMVPNDVEPSPEYHRSRNYVDDWIVDRRRWQEPGAPTGLLPLQPRLLAFVRDRLDAWRIGRESTLWYLGLYGPENRQGWERTQERVRTWDRRLRERGARLLLASWPLLVDAERGDPFAPIAAEVARFCRLAGIPRHDLRPALAGRPAATLWVHPVDHHPNEVANRLAAESLAPVVKALVEGQQRTTDTP